MPTPPFNLEGLWSFVGQQAVRDDVLSLKLGHVDSLGEIIPHGTYTKEKMYSVFMSSRDGVDDAVLDILDEEALATRFVWDGESAWVAAEEVIQYHLGTDRAAGVGILLSPGLVLTAFDQSIADW